MNAPQPGSSLSQEREAVPGRVVLRQLGRLRRRLRVVLAVRYALLAGAVAIVGAEAIVIAVGTTRRDAAAFLIAGVAAVLASSVAAAFVRTPSLGATAIAVDRNQALEDRAATALEFIGHQDPVATLVVQDAAEHLRTLLPATVFPLERPARWATHIGVVIATSLLVVFVLPRNSVDERPVTVPNAETGAVSAATPRASREASRMTATSPEGQRTPEEPTPAPSKSSVSPRGAAPAGSSQASKPDAGATSAVPESTSASQGAQRSASATPPSADPDVRESGAGSAQQDGSAGGASLTARGRAMAAGAAGAGGRGAAGTRASTASAPGGGTQGGALAQGNDRPAARSPAATQGPGYDARYRAALTRAQAALSQERVPAALRDYVKHYFEAIRSPRQQ